ncbi:hypothetical protein BVRB_5g117100 [Beta vulgaris subsp. vulgaris]|nr:hypothetical protein BVRB_5g117100 [Beta vulgaris subsp. vulgaris]
MSAEISGASISLSSESPSFSTYSSENIADIAARVVKELNLSENDTYDDDFYSSITLNDAFQPSSLNDAVEPSNDDKTNQNDDEEDDDDDKDEEEGTDSDDESEFEFAILNSSPISADEIFDNGQIKPMFPIFNTDLVYGYNNQNDAVSNHPPTTIRLQLRKLLEERENSNSNSNGTVSSSSSEADDLEGVPPGTYCVWAPKKKEEEKLMMKKKSKSTGSSKRWRFKDLLYTRSNSDGKDTFVFLTPSIHHKTIGVGGADLKRREKMVKKSNGMINDYNNSNSNSNNISKNKNKDKNKKSYLPYRRDLVGFFANVNGISRTVRPF